MKGGLLQVTRPKADADPWLSDMVAREREVSRTVVYGIRTVISLLREIRDNAAEESRALRRENAQLRDDFIAFQRQMLGTTATTHRPLLPPCDDPRCGLPLGHPGNHRGSLKKVG